MGQRVGRTPEAKTVSCPELARPRLRSRSVEKAGENTGDLEGACQSQSSASGHGQRCDIAPREVNMSSIISSSSPANWPMRVVLPAPLGPMTAWSSPGMMARSRAAVATTAPKCFTSRRTSSRGSVMAGHPQPAPDRRDHAWRARRPPGAWARGRASSVRYSSTGFLRLTAG